MFLEAENKEDKCNGMVDEEVLAWSMSYGGGAITHVGIGGAVV